ncbi:MAG: Sec-independent protein translocase protein TatB [Novosphingobium sp.]|nr:Sec-independent protein translocase protein TatB [Novosphingobium sp.]
MFDLGATELLLILIIAVVVIGPKDLPLAMRTAGRWIAKVRRVSSHFRSGLDTMVREAELEEMEQKWKAQNEAIMEEHPDPEDLQAPVSGSAEAAAEDQTAAKADPQLPLAPP